MGKLIGWARGGVWLLAAGMVLLASSHALGATYYVDSASGNDANTGLSVQSAWKSIAKVNAASLQAGDSVLFARGGVWRESLVIPSSGTTGNPIRFDAYGSGPAPLITGALDLPAASWSVDTGNVWEASVTSSTMNFALFGSVWGTKQSAKANLAADRDWYFAGNVLYVYAPSNPAAYYGSITAMLLTGLPLIYVNGHSNIEIQHFKLTYFDTYGVRIGGASDHVTVANVWAEGIIPNGVLPHGFYVLSTLAPAAINFYHDDAHRNYNGFRFDNTPGITLTNSRAYANRFYGMVDNTANIYSYSHFYGNTIGVLPSVDVSGGTDGGNNVPAYTWPGVVDFAKYPARVSFTVDDVGLTPGADAYINTLTPEIEKRGVRMSMGIQTGYANALIPTIQGWLANQHDPDSHSWSHTYYTNPTMFTLQYVGSGTAATLNIAGNLLTTTVTGGPGGENLSIDLTNPAFNMVHALVMNLNGRSGYAAVQDPNCQDVTHTYTLADVAGQDIRTAPYALQLLKSRFVPDELSQSKAWMEANIVGPGNARAYVWPAGISDTQTQGYAVTAGYEGARGNLSMALGSAEVYGLGVDIQNITSFGITSLHGLSVQQITDRMASLVFKAQAWGVPYGLFAHKDEVTPAEVGAMLDGLMQRGATILTNTQMIDAIFSSQRMGTPSYFVESGSGREPNLRATANSVVDGTGSNLGSTVQIDLDGRDRSLLGWDIGSAAVNGVTAFSGSGTFQGTGSPQ